MAVCVSRMLLARPQARRATALPMKTALALTPVVPVAVPGLVGGFLCSAGGLRLDGDILIWVFPALCLIYGAARAGLGRRHGGTGCA